MENETICRTDTSSCGGVSSLGVKCYGCIAYDVELDTRLGEED